MLYEITYGDATFNAAEFRAQAETLPDTGQRGAVNTTALTIEVWVNSNPTDLPADARKALFEYSFRPQTQDTRVLTAKVRRSGDASPTLCTYTFKQGWVTTYREFCDSGPRSNVQLYVKFRALVSEDPTSEVEVE